MAKTPTTSDTENDVDNTVNSDIETETTTVEAEVVDVDPVTGNNPADTPEPETLDAETIPADAVHDVNARPAGFLSPGVIFLGILALVAVVILLIQGKSGMTDTAQNKADPVAQNAAQTIVQAKETTAGQPAKIDEVATNKATEAAVAAAQPVAQEASKVSEATATINDMVKGDAPETVNVPDTTAQAVAAAEEARDSAMERARARRIANAAERAKANETTAEQTEITPAPAVASPVTAPAVETETATVAATEETLQNAVEETGSNVAEVAEATESVVTDASTEVVEEVAETATAATEEIAEKTENLEAAIPEAAAQEAEAAAATVENLNEAETPAVEAVQQADATETQTTEGQPADVLTAEAQPAETPTEEQTEQPVAEVLSPVVEDPNAIVAAPTAEEMEEVKKLQEAQTSSVTQTVAQDAPTVVNRPTVEALVETQEALAQERTLREQQGEEIARIRTDFDQALADQERRSQERVAELDQRLSRLQNQDVATATKQATISIALNKLQTQMLTGRPFRDELNVLQKLTSATQETKALEPYATNGLPTMSYLQQGFREASRKAQAAAQKSSDAKGLGKLMANIRGLFTVRKRGNISGDTPSAIISRAEYQLEQGDLSAALNELKMLEGEPAAAVANWRALAEAKLSGDKLIDRISGDLLAELR